MRRPGACFGLKSTDNKFTSQRCLLRYIGEEGRGLLRSGKFRQESTRNEGDMLIGP